MFVKIYYDTIAQITDNFSAQEIYEASHPIADNDWIEIDYNVVKIAQYIREQVGQITVNSAFRNSTYNTLIGGSPKSQHLLGRALDLSNPNIVKWMSEQLNNNSNHLTIMKNMGLRGVGLYDWGIHIDTKIAPFRTWDNRKKKA